MAAAPILLLDACVLYPAPLRDLLMRLAVHDLISAKWSERIHEEWIEALLEKRRDLTRGQLERVRELMDRHAGDCLVEGYEARIPTLALPDPDDRHVLVAAIEADAEAIVTWNLGDFPKDAVRAHGIDVWTPDELLARLIGENPDAVVQVMREHRRSLKNPPKSATEYLGTLSQQGLAGTVIFLQGRAGEL